MQGKQSFDHITFIPPTLPEPIFLSGIAKSAEASVFTEIDIAQEADFRIEINEPTNDVILAESNLQKLCGSFAVLPKSIWHGIEALSEGIADFLGVTTPRYEMYMDGNNEDSERCQIEIDSLEDSKALRAALATP